MMTKRKRVKLGEAAVYPTDAQAKGYAGYYRDNILPGNDPRTAYQVTQHDLTVDVLSTWGVDGIFFVYAYPPAGFVISKPEDVLKLQIFEGWILEYQAQDGIFNLLVKASRDGVDYFWQQHRLHKG